MTRGISLAPQNGARRRGVLGIGPNARLGGAGGWQFLPGRHGVGRGKRLGCVVVVLGE